MRRLGTAAKNPHGMKNCSDPASLWPLVGVFVTPLSKLRRVRTVVLIFVATCCNVPRLRDLVDVVPRFSRWTALENASMLLHFLQHLSLD